MHKDTGLAHRLTDVDRARSPGFLWGPASALRSKVGRGDSTVMLVEPAPNPCVANPGCDAIATPSLSCVFVADVERVYKICYWIQLC
jgi:hypothetical protein